MAAENAVSRGYGREQGRGASMRPRRMAAENLDAGEVRGVDARASMRPRRMAAENDFAL